MTLLASSRIIAIQDHPGGHQFRDENECCQCLYTFLRLFVYYIKGAQSVGFSIAWIFMTFIPLSLSGWATLGLKYKLIVQFWEEIGII
jgi:hypothetical protein